MAEGTKRWRCVICGYEHEGDAPPAECPLCGAGPEDFEPVGGAVAAPEPEATSSSATATNRIVIVGGGIAGTQAAKSARKASPTVEITLLTEEEEIPYQRINLTRYVAGGVAREKLPIHPASWYDENGIELLTGERVVSLSLDDRTVAFADGRTLPFDRLILANGARPFLPPVPGIELDGVTALRTKGNADDVIARAASCDRCVVVGGGILGLETAAGLAAKGTAVTVLEQSDWLMPRQLDERSSRRLQTHLEALGIDLRRNASLASIHGNGAAAGVRLEDGTEIAADLVIVAAGVRANLDLLAEAGLDVDRGAIVDDTCRTSHPAVYAAGDVAQHAGRMYGLWGPSQRQGAVAGTNAAGGEDAFDALPLTTSLKVLDTPVFSTGALAVERDGDLALWGEDGDRSYHLVTREARLIGAVVMGDMKAASKLRKAVEARAPVSDKLLAAGDVLGIVGAVVGG